ncbi:hypothetical protein ILUMI_06283, partial [Ignelater luminosus]
SWVFLARFCFLSERGEFEYNIEFNENEGSPNLLLYYDTEDQWPAVYKTNKTCYEKEAVLHPEQNQIINLTTQYPHYRDLAGCIAVEQSILTTPTPKYVTSTQNYKVPSTKKPRKQYYIPEVQITASTTDSTKFNESSNMINETYGSSNETPTKLSIIKKRSVYSPSRKNSNKLIICQNARRFQSSRARWWFVAVSNCNGSKGIHMKYKILMTNGPPGDYWHEHFSADEFYILPVLLAFCIAYSFLLLAIVLCSMELKSRQLLHSTYKLYVFSATLQFFGVLLQNAAYLKYAVNGVGSIAVKTFGSMFMGCSETCFLLLLLLLAKGYTITRGRLPLAASVKLTIFMCLYSVTYICIFVYEAKVFDPGEVLYLYESPAGYGLIILRIIAWLMFIYSTVFTLKHYPEKSNFYYPFNICGTLWFIAGPAFILSANSYIDKWVRESVVCAVLLLITFGGHLNFLILTMPSMANKNFPYHVRTSQIGVMEMTGTSGSSTIEHFSHHVYEPSSNVTEQAVIIPLTKRTEEIFGGLYSQHLNSNFATRNPQPQKNEDVVEEIDNVQNIAMQNVLTWSIAKNYTPLEISEFERFSQNIPVSPQSAKEIDFKNRLEQPDSGYNSSGNVQDNQLKSYNYDYVKDVPIELFTISKMVVKRTSNNGESSK